ncbi:ImuA protein [Methylobacterium sp. 77]|uniref:ImuA family protein n=1 Tax=Methylobacterium sp. 77 TaxID=1101192 RepID=UPI001FD9F34A|nr:ImuA protein [Methylobacterium sp. 77]
MMAWARRAMRDEDGTEADEPARRRQIALAALRDHRGPNSDAPAIDTLPLGIAHIDSGLPGGGLSLGRPHEIAPQSEGDEAAALGFTLALMARHLARVEGEALLVIGKGHPTPYGHGLAGLGLDPGRLLILEVENDADAYRAVEEALRSQGLRAVAGLVDAGLPLKQSRRLHLAGEAASRLLLVLRPPQAECPNMAATRWRIGSGAALRDRFGCIERPCWRARLDRCRNGRTGDWLLEWDHAAHRFGLAGAVAADAARTRSSHA